MFVRLVSFFGALASIVLLPVGCGSFSADDPATGPTAEGGASGGEGGVGLESGPPPDGSSAEGSTTSGPVELGSGYKVLRAIAATETDVFWIDPGSGGGIFTAPIIGGKTRTLVMGGAPSSIAVDGGHVYWTDTALRQIGRIDVAGLEPVQWSLADTGSGLPPSIVVGATGAVVALVGSTGATGEIRQYGLDLGATAMTANNLVNPFSLTAFGTSFYWTEGGAGAVARGDVGNARRTQLFAENDAEAIAADVAGVYWTVPLQSKIRGSVGGALPITLAAGEKEPRSIAADGKYVYWTTENNELRRAGHLDNGTSSLFASGFLALTEMHVRAVAVTSQYVVWLTADGKVLRASSK